MQWHWVDLEVVIAIHDQLIAEHGGSDGIRDVGLVESAMARPRNLSGYSTVDVFDLAAEYGQAYRFLTSGSYKKSPTKLLPYPSP